MPRSDTPLDVTLAEMLVALQRRMHLVLTFEPETTALPVTPIITVPEMADRIRARISSEQTLVFDSLFAGARSRVALLVALWAVLELLKRRVIVAEQGTLFGTIILSAGPQFAATALTALDSSEDQ